MTDQDRIQQERVMKIDRITSDMPVERDTHLRDHISSLDSVISRLTSSQAALHSFADRVLGSSPNEKAEAACNACPNGLIAECQEREEQLREIASSLEFAMERLAQVA